MGGLLIAAGLPIGTIALATAGFVAAGLPIVLALFGIPLGLMVTGRPRVDRSREPESVPS